MITGDICVQVQVQDAGKNGWIEIKFSSGRVVRFDGLKINRDRFFDLPDDLVFKPADADRMLAFVKAMTS